jgi:hypothetical protein
VPYVRDDRETPLCVGRDGEGYAGDLRQKGMEIFLKAGLDMQITFSFFVMAGPRPGHPRLA